MKFKRFISVFLLCTCLTGLFLTPAAGALEVPDIQAKAALLADVNTDAVAYAKTSMRKLSRQPDQGHDGSADPGKVSGKTLLNQEVTASENAFSDTYYHADGSSAGIKAGEVMTVKQLLQCMLIVSANEACNILAGVGRRLHRRLCGRHERQGQSPWLREHPLRQPQRTA